jgi:serine/threonine protein phosphatase 1
MRQVGIVGDIHGDVGRLRSLLEKIGDHADHLVFVGDYVNRGRDSAQVIQVLVNLRESQQPCTFIQGNHDRLFRLALTEDGFDAFLRIGGAATVRSYVSDPRGDVAAQFAAAVPHEHVDFLQTMVDSYRSASLVVAHSSEDLTRLNVGAAFAVSGHTPSVDRLPRIETQRASIDTGCGLWPDGRLTCLFWPSLSWIQD